ncbi:carbohydrate ABC transporter permease [Halobaculum sp. MBLA0147]|uniref:carbohydrate ABC transporter permease n=1 Tax=Halobaculum sp. MBLA0147 TaxID=3079934 RepID=UPI0035235D77
MSTVDETAEEGLDVNGYRVGLYLTLGALLVFFLTPIETGIVTSLKTPDAVATTSPVVPSLEGFTLGNYATAVQELLPGMVNSLLYAVPATILSALFGSFAAYGFTLTDWRGQVGVLLLFVAGIFIPYQAVLVPLTQFFSILSLGQSPIWGLLGIDRAYSGIVELIVTHTAYGIPICTILFRSYYKGMSEEMLESARLEGATVRRAYRRIVFPLSTPMFAVVLIYQFTQIWNDLLFALVLVQAESSAAAPVTLILAGLGASQSGTIFGLRMAGAFVAALPTLAVYVLFGEEFAKGVAT